MERILTLSISELMHKIDGQLNNIDLKNNKLIPSPSTSFPPPKK